MNWLLGPGISASEIIAERKFDEDDEPNEAGARKEPEEPGTVLEVHEKEHDENRFRHGDGHGDDEVVGVQVKIGSNPCGEQEEHQGKPDPETFASGHLRGHKL